MSVNSTYDGIVSSNSISSVAQSSKLFNPTRFEYVWRVFYFGQKRNARNVVFSNILMVSLQLFSHHGALPCLTKTKLAHRSG